MGDVSTITLRADTKQRLALLKGSRSWDDFLSEVADEYPAEEQIVQMERRLHELKSRRTSKVPWKQIKRGEQSE